MVWENKNVTTHMWVESQSAFGFCTKNFISNNNNLKYELDLMGTLGTQGTLACWTATHEKRLVMWYKKTFIVRPGSSPAWETFREYIYNNNVCVCVAKGLSSSPCQRNPVAGGTLISNTILPII